MLCELSIGSNLFCLNSLITRYWINLLRLPEMIFDVGSTVSIDVCLEVLVSNLAEACTNLSENSALRLGKDSPSSKLLFARDIPAYQQMILQYYKDVSSLPSINEGDIMAYMKDVSKVIP